MLYAAAGVADAYVQDNGRFAEFVRLYRKGNRAGACVFDGIGQDVQYALLQADTVAVEVARDGRVCVQHKVKLLFLRAEGNHVHQIEEDGCKVVVFRQNFHLARLYL